MIIDVPPVFVAPDHLRAACYEARRQLAQAEAACQQAVQDAVERYRLQLEIVSVIARRIS